MREYDKIGKLTAVVDPTGVRTDAATDRRTSTATVADAFSSWTISFDEYDPCGRLVLRLAPGNWQRCRPLWV
ncbi:hypothetical protein KKR91_01935 [Arthrobacter jiangjiafuii]|uniref:YD repeat-containing protein n=1 Tax=Arthrobacter jiangjiafuii TaxID=2817475 RepID=A0A975M5X7_9MICC|nr:hypothetical protein [Arthrobacter jiangjiafuii]MBP3044729.1 hypothetical protein [Arthrobacter jiangjiafuii]QWC10440.1 hypothetical protein KKR91_01935 [Arthrobacter jiangjiafuii]